MTASSPPDQLARPGVSTWANLAVAVAFTAGPGWMIQPLGLDIDG